MPEITLAPHHPADFHNAFTEAIRAEVERVCRLTDEAFLSTCEYEYTDGCCGRTATVFALEAEQHLCQKHFREVSRGR